MEIKSLFFRKVKQSSMCLCITTKSQNNMRQKTKGRPEETGEPTTTAETFPFFLPEIDKSSSRDSTRLAWEHKYKMLEPL